MTKPSRPLLQPFDRVTVECHARLVGRRCLEFADRIPGRLEVAMGLETVDAAALARLNKGMTLEDFDRTAARLSAVGIDLRVFVQLPAPFVPAARALESALDAVRYAVDRGAGHVTLIPSRDGNGAMDELREQGHWTRPAPELIEETAEGCARISGAVGIDPTDRTAPPNDMTRTRSIDEERCPHRTPRSSGRAG